MALPGIKPRNLQHVADLALLLVRFRRQLPDGFRISHILLACRLQAEQWSDDHATSDQKRVQATAVNRALLPCCSMLCRDHRRRGHDIRKRCVCV